MENNILQSWEANAAHWNAAIDNKELLSRQLVTNEAIINAVLNTGAKTIVDVGCGEGWLCRALQQKGIQTYGIDGTAELVALARSKDAHGRYDCISFQSLVAADEGWQHQYDAVVINFALYEEAQTEELLSVLRNAVHAAGCLIIQTLHPCFFLKEGISYQSQWLTEDWAGLQRPFAQPYRWFYRTMSDWIKAIQLNGWQLKTILEPLHPETKKAASLILIANVGA